MALQKPGLLPGRQKRLRLFWAAGAFLMLALAVSLVLNAMNDSLVFFVTPSEATTRDIGPGQQFRLGGLVLEGSVSRSADNLTVEFRVTDLMAEIPVRFTGILPDLFREGQGVVAEGRFDADGVFEAHSVLAKHDENYMPAEVTEALKKSGRWQDSPGQDAPGQEEGSRQ